MKKTIMAAAVAGGIAVSASQALAGGFDLTGQPILGLFEKGNFAEFTLGQTQPDFHGSTGPVSTGNPVNSFGLAVGYVKSDLSDKLSYALFFDQPYRRELHYTEGLYSGIGGKLQGFSATGLLRYKLTDRFSVYGGLRAQSLDLDADIPLSGYQLRSDTSYGLGYVVGAAFEIPEYYIRAALTYNSAISHDFDATENGVASQYGITTPASINLDLQSPVSKTTLVFASVRRVNWAGTDIAPPIYTAASGAPLLSYTRDTTTYTLGAAHLFSPTLTGYVRLTQEDPTREAQSIFIPFDGARSIGVGAIYTKDKLRVTAGVEYIEFGDKVGLLGSFTGNSGLAVGLRLGFAF